MANPLFLATDLSAVTVTASVAANASFPLTNLQTYFSSDAWKSSTNTNQSITFDFGAAIACDTIVLDACNMSSLSLTTANLEYSTDNSTWSTAVDLKTLGTGGWVQFTTQTKRYWRINYVFSSTTNAPTIGNWFIGTRFDPGFPYNNQYKNSNRKYETNEAIALDGRIRTSQAYTGRKTWEFDLTALTDSVKTSFQTFYLTTRGKMRPFYFLDTDGTTLTIVHFDMDLDPSTVMRYNINDLKKIVMKGQLVG